MARMAQIELPVDAGDFRLMDRRALDVLLAMPERNRFLRGMTVWVGFNQTAVTYRRDPRTAGLTKFNLRRMVRFSFDAISSFSYFPLQAATLLGFAISLLAFLVIPVIVYARIKGVFVPGVSSTLVALLLLGGIQLITVGVIGEYVGRIYDEVKRRPLYVVRERINLDADVAPRQHS
jgi:dolichol-phosphate mannosyltransferase